MLISIVVCTYNRSEFLKKCLDTIINETSGYSNIEVIVVDNASKDNTKELVAKYAAVGVNYIYESNQGLSFARNIAFKKAKGCWVAYVDDDAILRSGWLVSILYTIENFDFDCFGGPYYPWYKDGKKNWFPDIYGSNVRWLDYHYTQQISGAFSGGNAIYKRELLLNSPGFPTNVGMAGGKQAYGEETYLIKWLRNNVGAKVGFVPMMIIDHFVPLHKQCLSWFIRRAFTEGRDFAISNFGMKQNLIYIGRCLLSFILVPFILVHLFLLNKYKLSLTSVLVEVQRPVTKLVGFISSFFIK